MKKKKNHTKLHIQPSENKHEISHHPRQIKKFLLTANQGFLSCFGELRVGFKRLFP